MFAKCSCKNINWQKLEHFSNFIKTLICRLHTPQKKNDIDNNNNNKRQYFNNTNKKKLHKMIAAHVLCHSNYLRWNISALLHYK